MMVASLSLRLYSFLRVLMATFVVMSTFAILLALVTFVLNPSQTFALPAATNLQQLLLPSYFHSEHSGWESSDSCHKDEWNILYHLGGNGPWVEKVDGVATGGIEVPEGCSVDMVHMVCSTSAPVVSTG